MSQSKYIFTTTIPEAQSEQLHALYRGEWWSRERTLSEVQTVLKYSDFVFAFCEKSNGRLVAFARVLTDRIFKAIIFDVIVAPENRGEGLGRLLVERIMESPELRNVQHLELYCLPDLVPFYEKLGFSTDVSGVCLMRKPNDSPIWQKQTLKP